MFFRATFICITFVGFVFPDAGAIELEKVPNDWQFHSDDHSLTSRVNEIDERFSTGVDTAQILMDELEYNTPVLNIPLNRSFRLMERGAPVCVINKIKSEEREQKYLFSLPLNFFQTQRLYKLANLPPIKQSFLDDNGAVLSISKLLQAYPNAAIVLPKNYSFGTRVDNDLSKIDEEQIIAITNQSFYARFMQLFVAKKADFALIFPYTINRNFGDDIPIQVRSYRISGNPDFVSGHAICPDTINGQRVITTVNQAIRNIYKNASFMQAHLDYLPSDNHPEFISKIQSSTGFAAKQALRH